MCTIKDMMKYLIQVTQDLTACWIILAMVLGFLVAREKKSTVKFICIGIALGAVSSITMAIMERTTALVDTPLWNYRILQLAVLATVVFIVMIIVTWKKENKILGLILDISAMIMAINYIFFTLPEVLLYPGEFVLADQSIFSTEFIFKFAGYLAALLLVLLIGLAMYRVTKGLPEKTARILMVIALLVQTANLGISLLSIALARRFVVLSHEVFVIVKNFLNAGDYFIIAILLVTVVLPIVLWRMSLHPREEYDNPAQRRKINKKWRTRRRWSIALVAFYIVTAMTLTVVQAYNNKGVELSPSEPIDLEGDEVHISLDKVEDGHLHRFTYETDDGIGVRFIIIKKPNSQAYGVGLDACDICGETGYYERDDQVVCKLCDVVMNINTIGFKGGCNPIPIDFKVQDGKIIVPTETLIKHKDEFK